MIYHNISLGLYLWQTAATLSWARVRQERRTFRCSSETTAKPHNAKLTLPLRIHAL